MSLTYSQYVTTLANLLVMDENDPDFVQILRSIIDYAEQRIYADLDLLATVVRDSSANATANSRNFTLPTSLGRFEVVNGINIITPVGSDVSNGTRNQVVPISRDYMDAVWTTNTAASATTVPTNFAMITDQTIVFGPPPGAAFAVEVIGTIRPTPLSVSNETTFLTLYMPQLFIAASMVFATGWQKNFGAQADNPQMAVSWETQYKTLFSALNVEENKKKFASSGWSSLQPTPIATPSR